MPRVAWIGAVWLILCLARDSSEALTTFGKTNPQTPSPPKATPPPGRECSRESECAGIAGTSCVKDPNDGNGKTRCLCGDNSSPINGRCEARLKGLHHACTESEDCLDGMVCGMPNATARASNSNYRPIKMCLCNQEEGYVERDWYCSGAGSPGLASSLLAAVLLYLLTLY